MVVTGEPPYPNAKVFSLDRMLAAAANDLVVMSDSDIRVTPDLLANHRSRISGAHLGVATCPYRAVPGPSFWSRLEAIGMNTDFWGGALVARMLEGMQFAVGPTIAARRSVLQSIGGFARLKDYLAEDFVLGKFAAEAGHGVILSSYVIEHHIGSATFGNRMWSTVCAGPAARGVRVPPDISASCSPCRCRWRCWSARSRRLVAGFADRFGGARRRRLHGFEARACGRRLIGCCCRSKI